MSGSSYLHIHIDDIMKDKERRTSKMIHEKLMNKLRDEGKHLDTFRSLRNFPSAREISSYLTYSAKYRKVDRDEDGVARRNYWRLKDGHNL